MNTLIMNWIPIQKYDEIDTDKVLAKSGNDLLIGYCCWSDYDD